MTSSVIIPMAGNGERFRRQGYLAPKFKIRVRGETLFHWALLSLRQFAERGAEFVFAARPEHDPGEFIERECALLGLDRYTVWPVERLTDGQATTALLAGESVIEPGAPCLIYNIDTFVEPDWLSPDDVLGDGWIPCFPGEGDGWSFALARPDGRVVEVQEKRRISPHASIGLYWFRSYEIYRSCYQQHFCNVAGTAIGERYIAPMYNTLIAGGGEVFLQPIPKRAVHPLGTPQEVEVFANER
jgi:hypothetical protein